MSDHCANEERHDLDASQAADRRILWLVLLINVSQCLAGVGVGLWAASTAVLGAALDNLADALVYGVSLYAVGRSPAIKVRAARLSGWFLIGLAVMLCVEVLRRFFGGEAPLGPAMMVMAGANAAMNIICLRLLKRHRGEDVNFKASAIFTNNDSIVNLAIVLSGALVMWWGSNLPDLVLGLVVSAIAANGGREILAEAAEVEEKARSEAT
ncbi:cation transporter (plasmid) [Cupriavidus sp. P-10]|uniref:cation transporter n=1 Tax=Cupriavidus sp. P-10 TaxID=2027911 RepID=UPI000E2EF291|nr:cation transporter [Cupriavidus sp. P-10]BDB29211.1 cation transporter [Cupriavidus sp. P-10]